MTDHIWKQIRDKFLCILRDRPIIIDWGGHLPTVRTEPVFEPNPEDLPIYTVYWTEEEILDRTRDDMRRAVNFVVESWFSGEHLLDWLSAMAHEAQSAIEVDHTLGGTVTQCMYAGASQVLSGEGAQRSGVVRMNFVCIVITAHGNPGLRA